MGDRQGRAVRELLIGKLSERGRARGGSWQAGSLVWRPLPPVAVGL